MPAQAVPVNLSSHSSMSTHLSPVKLGAYPSSHTSWSDLTVITSYCGQFLPLASITISLTSNDLSGQANSTVNQLFSVTPYLKKLGFSLEQANFHYLDGFFGYWFAFFVGILLFGRILQARPNAHYVFFCSFVHVKSHRNWVELFFGCFCTELFECSLCTRFRFLVKLVEVI